MGSESKHGLSCPATRGSFISAKSMGKVHCIFRMDRNTKVLSYTASFEVILRVTRSKGMESIFSQIIGNMRANGKITRCTVWVI
jgi:hypothetical protein